MNINWQCNYLNRESFDTPFILRHLTQNHTLFKYCDKLWIKQGINADVNGKKDTKTCKNLASG